MTQIALLALVKGLSKYKVKQIITLYLVWVYNPPPPPIRNQNIKFIPIFLLLTSHFMFWTYQGLKKVMWVKCVGGGGEGCAWWVVLAHGL